MKFVTHTLDDIIKKHNGHFFSKDTMRFFGDRITSFTTVDYDGDTYLCRRPTATVNVFGSKKRCGRTYFNAWRFNPKSGDLVPVSDDIKEECWSLVNQII